MKRILVCVLAIMSICTCLFLTACKLEKVYHFESMRVEQVGGNVEVKRNDTFNDIKYHSDSIVLDVKEDKTFTFRAEGLLEETSGVWETITNSNKQETVLNFNHNGGEIILGSVIDGTATVWLYANGVDYKIVLK